MNDEQILDMIFQNNGEFVFDKLKSNAPPKVDPSVQQKIKLLEKKAIEFSEKGNYQEALLELDKALELCSNWGSVWNNKAQVHKLMSELEKALECLDKAIEFGDVPVLRQAYTQRAIIKKELGQSFEEDLKLGAQYGNEIAKSMIQQNPFAKMCNAIMTDILLTNSAANDQRDQ
jgi:tetratricopeptide (TPR) repeat protein